MSLLDRFFARLTPDRFARLMMKALRDAGDHRAVKYESAEFRLVYEQGAVLNLCNFFADYRKAPKSQRGAALKAMVRGALAQLKEIPDEFADARHDLRPRIWTRAMIESLRLQSLEAGGRGFDSPWMPVGEHLAALLVYDFPEAVRSIGRDDLDNWGVTFYEAMEVARQNLEQSQFAFASMGESFYGSLTGDTYDASRLLMLDMIGGLKVDGDPVAMVPSRDSLLITGSNDAAGLGIVLDFAEKALREETRTLIGIPLRLVDGEWVDWLPPEEHPHHNRAKALAVGWLADVYQSQKQQLDALHAKQELDIFVASFTVMREKETGRVSSYSMWAAGVDTLLPRADEIVFFRPPEELVARVRWDLAEPVVGELMELTEDYPARFRIREFPSEQQLAELRQIASP